MNANDLVGKRCLFTLNKNYSSVVDEYKVLEISPSGVWIKLMNLNGNKFWKTVSEVSFVEELQDLKAGKPQ